MSKNCPRSVERLFPHTPGKFSQDPAEQGPGRHCLVLLAAGLVDRLPRRVALRASIVRSLAAVAWTEVRVCGGRRRDREREGSRQQHRCDLLAHIPSPFPPVCGNAHSTLRRVTSPRSGRFVTRGGEGRKL